MRFKFGIRETAISIIVIIILATGLVAPSLIQQANSSTSATNRQTTTNHLAVNVGSFKSYSQLQAFMAANAKSAQQYNGNVGGLGFEVPGVTETSMSSSSVEQTGSASSSTPSFTGTNVQVQGVDEPDSVKTDGLHIFVATAGAVTIINAYPPNSTSKLSTLFYPGESVLGIDISLNRLAVINERSSNATYIDLLIYDTSNPSAPKLMENESISGSYVSARLTQGYLYAIIQQPSFQYNPQGNLSTVMPTATENGATMTLQPSSVYYTYDRAQISYYTMIVSISMDTGKESTLSVLTGPSSTIYVSTSNIYIVYALYQDYYADSIPGDIFTGGVMSSPIVGGGQNSTILRAAYSNGIVTVGAAGSVPGTILNQFSLDEYNGFFRVATSRFATIDGTNTQSDDVYVLNQNLTQVAALRNIAPGENIYAVRFDGDTGYVVTFQQVDPLFVISFQNITNPVIKSALKVSGYSDYLQPIPGGYLIGVGKDAVPSSTGNFSYYLGLKLSLFRVFGNGTSIQVSKYLIGDRGTDSPVLNDHLAFTYDATKNITVIPVLLAKVSGNQSQDPNNPPPFGDYVWQGDYVFKVTSAGFSLLGTVSQYPPGLNYGDSPVNNLDIYRSIIIGNYLYTISSGEVMVSDLASFSTVANVTLPGN
jgi:inhibitor of cysteine peptidase